MRNPFTIEDTPSNKISYYHLLLFVISLPFDRLYSELVLASLTVHVLIQARRADWRKALTRNVLTIQAVFFLTAFGIFYSTNTGQALAMLARQSAIFILPLVLALISLDLEKYKARIFLAFAITCLLCIAYLYLDAFRTMLYYHLPLRAIISPAFLNHNFSEPLDIHATYLSMYVALSILYLAVAYHGISSKKKRAVIAAAMILLSAGLLQLGSRSVLLAAIGTGLVAFPVLFIRGRTRAIRFGLSVTAVAVIVMVPIFVSGSLRNRYINDLEKDLGKNNGEYSNTTPRIERWKLALGLVMASPVTGYGSGDETDLLSEKYFEHKFYNSYLFRLNSHNQYISFLLRSGIIGLLVYLAVLFSGFQSAARRRDPLFLGLMIMLAIVSCSENYLDVNKGIFFYAFFLSLFVISKIKYPVPGP